MTRGRWANVNKARARAKPAPGALNTVEEAWARRLKRLELAGEVLWWRAKPGSLRLAHQSFYLPDFVVVLADMTIRYDEVKGTGSWQLDDEGRTKWKVAGELWPMFVFQGASARRKKDGGGWDVEVYEPVGAWPGYAPEALTT